MRTLIAYVGKLGAGKAYHMMKQVELLKTTGNTVYLISFADPIKQILKNSFGLTKEGKIENKEFRLEENYVKHQIINSLYDLIKKLDYEKFDISEQDAKLFILNNYEKYEKEFYAYIVHAYGGLTTKTQHEHWDYNFCFRRLGQMLGTELARHLVDSIWIDIAINKIKVIFKQGLADFCFIDDLRFINEFNAVNKFRDETAFNSEIFGVVASDETRAKRRVLSMDELKEQDSHGSENEIDSIIKQLTIKNIINNN